MNYIDILILIFLVLGFILGFKDGLIRKIIGIIGFIAAIGLSVEFYPQAGSFISPIFGNDPYLSNIIGGLLIFTLTMFAVVILKRIIHPIDKVNKFMNQLLGGISGILQMVFFISGFLLFLNIFNFPSNDVRNKSLFYSTTYRAIPFVIDFMLGSNAKAKKIILDSIESSENNVLDMNDV